MIARVQRAGNTGSLVQAVHSSFITLGVVVGSWFGGIGINAYGLRAPLWVGAVLAMLALLAMIPAIGPVPRSFRAAQNAPQAPAPAIAESGPR